MRDRLVIAFVGLTVTVIALYGIPRAYFLADLVRDEQRQELVGAAAMLEALVVERADHGEPVDESVLRQGLVAADHIEYVAPDGSRVVVGAADDTQGGVHVTRDLEAGGALVLGVSGDTVGDSIRSAIMPLVLLGLALAAAAGVLGALAARRLSQPFQELAEHSRELGRGRFDVDVPLYAVPEANAIAVSLRGAASDLHRLVQREREFAANASHQLRTPITALRLNLEDLTLWPETDPAVRAELNNGLAELDRLTRSIDDLLDLARGQRLDAQQQIDLAAVATAAGERWQRQVADADRVLTTSARAPALTRVPIGPVEQVLDVLIDNALTHGRGQIVVTAHDAGTHVELVVADDGPRPASAVFGRGVTTRDGQETPHAHGIGLAVATELADSCGGHLSLDTASTTTRFVLWLPKARTS